METSSSQSSLIKDFFQGYEPLQYALEPNESPVFNDYQDENFQIMLNLFKNKYVTKNPISRKNIFIVSFCITVFILLLISHKFTLLSNYDQIKNKRVPNIKIIALISIILSLIITTLN